MYFFNFCVDVVYLLDGFFCVVSWFFVDIIYFHYFLMVLLLFYMLMFLGKLFCLER